VPTVSAFQQTLRDKGRSPAMVRGVRPLRARIGHRLHRCVRVGKRFAEPLARVPDLAVEPLKVAVRERRLEKMRRGHCIFLTTMNSKWAVATDTAPRTPNVMQ
jgi:hypothetical protein